MTKRIRLIILLVCVACFLIIAPVLVLYSMGDRFDFAKMKITATGGIYVRTFPSAGQIIIDSKITQKPGLFSNSVFVQSLLPKSHTVLVKKDGYHDYFKTIPVKEKEVTKLENILLIESSIQFTNIINGIDYFAVSPNNQNIITLISGSKNTTLNYSSLSSTSQPQTLSLTQIGKISDVKWSDDSSMALIGIQNYANTYYYLFNSNPPASDQESAPKVTAIRISYLDKTAKQISFNAQDSQQVFFIKNKALYSGKNNNASIIIKNVIAYKISGENIIWLSTTGLIYKSDISGKLIGQLAEKGITINPAKDYKIYNLSGKTYLQAGDSLFLLNQDSKILENVAVPDVNYKILASSDNKNLIYWNNNKIYLYSFDDKKYEELYSGNSITSCQWLNNDYIIFADGNKIIISEIDYRGNINTITLPQTITLSSDKKVELKNPSMFFNSQDGKIYILTDNALLSSKKITP